MGSLRCRVIGTPWKETSGLPPLSQALHNKPKHWNWTGQSSEECSHQQHMTSQLSEQSQTSPVNDQQQENQ